MENKVTYTDIMNVIRCGNKLTGNQARILIDIMDYHNLKVNGDWNNTPLAKLTKEVGLDKTNVLKNIKRLADMGLITKKAKVHKSANDYIPNIEAIRIFVSGGETLPHDGGETLPLTTQSGGETLPLTTQSGGETLPHDGGKTPPNTFQYNTNKYNTISHNLNNPPYISPQEPTAEKQTDGYENSNTQNEAIHNTNERTSGKRNEGFRDLDNGDRDNNTNSDNHNSNNQTAEKQNDGYENSNNVDKANHNSNEHGIGNPSESFDEFELRLAMQSEGITQPEVDIYQIPDIPNEPNEDILQQAYDWFNGNGDYDPISLPNEEPITPKNASEGLKATETNNYTKANGNALKTAEKPQKSNCAAESTNVRDNNTPQNGNNTPKNAPTSAQNFQWVLQPTKGCDWRSVKIAIENLRPSETRRTQSLQPLIDGVYNKYRVIETLQMTKEHCISWRQKANFHVVANVYWRAIVWYSDPNTGYTKSQIEFVYNLLSDINKLIREYDTYKVSNTVYMAFKTAGNNLKPMLTKPKIAA